MCLLNNPREAAIVSRLRHWIRNPTDAAPPRTVRNKAFLRLTMKSGMEVDSVGLILRCSMGAAQYGTNAGGKPLCMSGAVAYTSIRDGWDVERYMWEFRIDGVMVAVLCYHCASVIRRASSSGDLPQEDLRGTSLVYLGDEIYAWGAHTHDPWRDSKNIAWLTDSQAYAWMRQRNAGAKESKSPHETPGEEHEVAAK